jgi:hypothetical protein
MKAEPPGPGSDEPACREPEARERSGYNSSSSPQTWSKDVPIGSNTALHDGIVGVLVLAGTLLGALVNPIWYWVPGIVGALMIQSAFTGFCPVYFTLGRLRGSVGAS